MEQLGVPIGMANAAAFQVGLKGASWTDFIGGLLASLRDEFAPRYQEIARIAATDGDPLAIEVADHMVRHEHFSEGWG